MTQPSFVLTRGKMASLCLNKGRGLLRSFPVRTRHGVFSYHNARQLPTFFYSLHGLKMQTTHRVHPKNVLHGEPGEILP